MQDVADESPSPDYTADEELLSEMSWNILIFNQLNLLCTSIFKKCIDFTSFKTI